MSLANISCSLKSDGSMWTWGDNTYGELGDNTLDNKSSPVLVVGNHSFVEVSAGGYHTTARKADGSTWTWGYNSDGQLGDNTIDNKSSPVLVVGNHSFATLHKLITDISEYELPVNRQYVRGASETWYEVVDIYVLKDGVWEPDKVIKILDNGGWI